MSKDKSVSSLFSKLCGSFAHLFLFLYLWNHTNAPWNIFFITLGVSMGVSVAFAFGEMLIKNLLQKGK